MPKRNEYQDLTGKKFGKLDVLRLDSKNKYGHYIWLCRCECGNTCLVKTSGLNRGTSSCGCIHRNQLIERNKKHGMSKTPIYSVWCAIISRCENKNYKQYKDYGGRGITVCDKWKTFDGFYEDMKDGYLEWLTIDRIDNEKGYSKENCRWVDMFTQASNTRKNVYYSIDGITDTQMGHCRRYNIAQHVVYKRIKRGWDIEKAYKTPLKK